jgi:hypothetical protein
MEFRLEVANAFAQTLLNNEKREDWERYTNTFITTNSYCEYEYYFGKETCDVKLTVPSKGMVYTKKVEYSEDVKNSLMALWECGEYLMMKHEGLVL